MKRKMAEKRKNDGKKEKRESGWPSIKLKLNLEVNRLKDNDLITVRIHSFPLFTLKVVIYCVFGLYFSRKINKIMFVFVLTRYETLENYYVTCYFDN